MSYDQNSLETRKGKLGEQIVKQVLESWGLVVTRPDGKADNEASLIDFHAKPANGSQLCEQLVEVKVRKAMEYAYGQAPCYTFPVAQLESYMNYAEGKGLPLTLWVVDPSRMTIFVGVLANVLGGLEQKIVIDGREFPFTKESKIGTMRHYHLRQFRTFPLSEKDKQKFDELEQEAQCEPENPTQESPSAMLSLFPEDSATAPPCTATTAPAKQNALANEKRTITAPNGSVIGIWEIDGKDGEFFLLRQVWKAIGYDWVINDKGNFATNLFGNTKPCRAVTFVSHNARPTMSLFLAADNMVPTLEKYITLTYGAKQGTKKYARNMAAAELLDFLKSEGFT